MTDHSMKSPKSPDEKKTRAFITLINFLHFYCEEKFVFVESKRDRRTKESDNGKVTSAQELPRHETVWSRDMKFAGIITTTMNYD